MNTPHLKSSALITFERTHDLEVVRQVVSHPSLWPFVSDDFSGTAEGYRPVEHESIWYITVHADEKLLGVFLLTLQSGCCFEIHTCLLPCSWGPQAKAASLGIVEWIWANTRCERIITSVPAYNRLALRFAEKAGMKLYGRNTLSWIKNGKLWDQLLLGLSRPQR